MCVCALDSENRGEVYTLHLKIRICYVFFREELGGPEKGRCIGSGGNSGLLAAGVFGYSLGALTDGVLSQFSG